MADDISTLTLTAKAVLLHMIREADAEGYITADYNQLSKGAVICYAVTSKAVKECLDAGLISLEVDNVAHRKPSKWKVISSPFCKFRLGSKENYLSGVYGTGDKPLNVGFVQKYN